MEQASPKAHVVRPLLQRVDSGHSRRGRVVCMDNIGGLWTSNRDLMAALKPIALYVQVLPGLALMDMPTGLLPHALTQGRGGPH